MDTKPMSTLAFSTAVLLALPGPAAAESTWQLASDSAEGDVRFLVDASQLDHYVGANGVQLFGAPIRGVANGIVKDGYVVIDSKSCLTPLWRHDHDHRGCFAALLVVSQRKANVRRSRCVRVQHCSSDV